MHQVATIINGFVNTSATAAAFVGTTVLQMSLPHWVNSKYSTDVRKLVGALVSRGSSTCLSLVLSWCVSLPRSTVGPFCFFICFLVFQGKGPPLLQGLRRSECGRVRWQVLTEAVELVPRCGRRLPGHWAEERRRWFERRWTTVQVHTPRAGRFTSRQHSEGGKLLWNFCTID